MVIRWVDVGLNAEAWTLASISPLTLVEPMCCVSCGLTGSVIDGRWIE